MMDETEYAVPRYFLSGSSRISHRCLACTKSSQKCQMEGVWQRLQAVYVVGSSLSCSRGHDRGGCNDGGDALRKGAETPKQDSVMG